jgi:hypothetical protein
LAVAEEKYQIDKDVTQMLEQRNVGIRLKHGFFFIEINEIFTEVTALPPSFLIGIKTKS